VATCSGRSDSPTNSTFTFSPPVSLLPFLTGREDGREDAEHLLAARWGC
jgi:hypothetical protein